MAAASGVPTAVPGAPAMALPSPRSPLKRQRQPTAVELALRQREDIQFAQRIQRELNSESATTLRRSVSGDDTGLPSTPSTAASSRSVSFAPPLQSTPAPPTATGPTSSLRPSLAVFHDPTASDVGALRSSRRHAAATSSHATVTFAVDALGQPPAAVIAGAPVASLGRSPPAAALAPGVGSPSSPHHVTFEALAGHHVAVGDVSAERRATEPNDRNRGVGGHLRQLVASLTSSLVSLSSTASRSAIAEDDPSSQLQRHVRFRSPEREGRVVHFESDTADRGASELVMAAPSAAADIDDEPDPSASPFLEGGPSRYTAPSGLMMCDLDAQSCVSVFMAVKATRRPAKNAHCPVTRRRRRRTSRQTLSVSGSATPAAGAAAVAPSPITTIVVDSQSTFEGGDEEEDALSVATRSKAAEVAAASSSYHPPAYVVTGATPTYCDFCGERGHDSSTCVTRAAMASASDGEAPRVTVDGWEDLPPWLHEDNAAAAAAAGVDPYEWYCIMKQPTEAATGRPHEWEGWVGHDDDDDDDGDDGDDGDASSDGSDSDSSVVEAVTAPNERPPLPGPATTAASNDSASTDAFTNCAICMNIFADGVSVVRRLPCLHLFHSVCIERWLAQQPVCPICKLRLEPVVSNPRLARGRVKATALPRAAAPPAVAPSVRRATVRSRGRGGH